MQIELRTIKIDTKNETGGGWTANLFIEGVHTMWVSKLPGKKWPELRETPNGKAKNEQAIAYVTQQQLAPHIHGYIIHLFEHRDDEKKAKAAEKKALADLEKMCRSVVLFRHSNHKEGEYDVSRMPDSAKHRKYLQETYAALEIEIVEFINDRFTPAPGNGTVMLEFAPTIVPTTSKLAAAA